jgi:hypothetical protein
MYTVLIALGGICWAITYVLIIKKGFDDKTFGMPIAALVGNITWEFLYSVKFIPPDIQYYSNLIWLIFDCIILYQVIKYWRNDVKNISASNFYTAFTIFLITGLMIHYAFAKEFSPAHGAAYTGFGQNALMSISFLIMLFKRQSLNGQSISIALSKLIGTLCPILAFYKYPIDLQGSKLLAFMFIIIFIFDVIYLICLILIKHGKLFLIRATH